MSTVTAPDVRPDVRTSDRATYVRRPNHTLRMHTTWHLWLLLGGAGATLTGLFYAAASAGASI